MIDSLSTRDRELITEKNPNQLRTMWMEWMSSRPISDDPYTSFSSHEYILRLALHRREILPRLLSAHNRPVFTIAAGFTHFDRVITHLEFLLRHYSSSSVNRS